MGRVSWQVQKGALMDKIGKRAAEAILQKIGGSPNMEYKLAELELSRQSVYQWEIGKHTPSAKALARLAHAGYDVHYILTGEKHGCKV